MQRQFRKLLIPLLVIATFIPIEAAYVIHSVKGDVILTSRNKKIPAAKGVFIMPSDMLTIPQGAKIEIRNDANNTIYSSVRSGDMTVSSIIHESRALATDNSANINSRLKFADRGAVKSDGKVYREKGMVTRSACFFDSIASAIEINPAALAQLIANTVYFGDLRSDSTLNFAVIHPSLEQRPSTASPSTEDNPEIQEETLQEESMTADTGFYLSNPLTTPIYFNIIRISGIGSRKVEISPLGTPAASYVLPAGQSIIRTQASPLPYGEKHILVAAHYSYNVDQLLDALTEIINDDTKIINDPDPSLPIFIRQL